MKERWYTTVEFTYNVHSEPSKQRYKGDADIDFAMRAFFEGLHPRLTEAFNGKNGINWTVIPQKVGNQKHLAIREIP